MSTYVYRRELNGPDRTRALAIGAGVGVAAGLAAAYLAGLFMQRTPLGGAVVLNADRNQPLPRVTTRMPLPR